MAEVRDYSNPEKKIDPLTCAYCKGVSSVRDVRDGHLITSQEWCNFFGTCSATIDWDKVYGHE